MLAGCADPKYAPAPAARSGGEQQKVLTCEAKFADGHCVSIQWETFPTEEDYGSFLLKVFRPNRADGSAVLESPGVVPAVVLWMPSMGHGSSPVTVEQLDTGTYRASDVFFSMKGDWDIRIQLKQGDDVRDQALVQITL